jgi:hypothetical protein
MASDILFKNDDICILKPESPRGILVFTRAKSENVCTEGILSYNELKLRHPELNLGERYHNDPAHNDLIFFRAPYNTDTSTFESSYDGIPAKETIDKWSPVIALIRIDPDNSFVYLSEARSNGSYNDVLNSRMPMRKYLDQVLPFIKSTPKNPLTFVYYKKLSASLYKSLEEHGSFVNRFFEVVAKIPNIPREWLVSCDVYNKEELSFKKYNNVRMQQEKMPPVTQEASPQQNYKEMADKIIALLSDIKMNDGVSITTQFYNPNIVRIIFKGTPYKSYKYPVYISIQLPGKTISGNTQDVREDDMTKIKDVLATVGGKYRNKSRRSNRSKRFRRSKHTKRK